MFEVSEQMLFYPPKYDDNGVLIDPGTYRFGGHSPLTAHRRGWQNCSLYILGAR